MRRSHIANLVVAIVAGVAFLAGLLISGVPGALLLLGVAAFLIVLTSAAWTNIPARGRRARILIVAVVILVAVVKLATR